MSLPSPPAAPMTEERKCSRCRLLFKEGEERVVDPNGPRHLTLTCVDRLRDALSFESVPISVASELVDQVKILRSEAARAWLPIESAPKDGTHILYSGTADGIICWVGEGRWIDEEGWWDANVNPHDYVGEQQWPTHWQPLPQPPDAGAEGPES